MAEKGTVKTDRFEMEYASFGSGNEAFVILPGISLNSVIDARDAVEAAYAVIAEKYKVYLFDMNSKVWGNKISVASPQDRAGPWRKPGASR